MLITVTILLGLQIKILFLVIFFSAIFTAIYSER